MKLTDLPPGLLATRPHLFSPVMVEIEARDLDRMRELIAAIESVVALPAWREFTKEDSHEALADTSAGVFLGYDFHLTPAGPRLIEINTNAGGALLSALQSGRDDVLECFVAMFRAECGTRKLLTLAIVDEQPVQQYLYPEFLGFKQLFAEHGMKAFVCDPADLLLCHGGLWYVGEEGETRIDLVYNRLTDFTLTAPQHAALREAWREGACVLTPNPIHHARYADKRNLIALSDEAWLIEWGVAREVRKLLLEGIPRTERVVAERAGEFWQRRRQLFFKPAAGYGAKGSYRGDKLTKRVFEEILAGDYVAQAFVPPSTVTCEMAGEPVELKADIRNYVYRGKVQHIAARLYQGQTTNFRTPGGGFAIVRIRQ